MIRSEMSDTKSINLGFWPNLGCFKTEYKICFCLFQLHKKGKKKSNWYHIVLKVSLDLHGMKSFEFIDR